MAKEVIKIYHRVTVVKKVQKGENRVAGIAMNLIIEGVWIEVKIDILDIGVEMIMMDTAEEMIIDTET